MSVYVDKAAYPHGNMIMCHMIADTLTELHAMADALGLKREYFQPRSFPHYDLAKSKRAAAIAFGAIEVSRKELVAHMKRIRPTLTPTLAVQFADSLNAAVRRGLDTP